jgi:hypothetical protein
MALEIVPFGQKTVNILGTAYAIIVKKYDEEEAFERRSICGFCDGCNKEIVVCDMATYKGWEHEDQNTINVSQKDTLRHEITHAFLTESGLACNTAESDGWARNEEMVDWIALQGPKIYAAWVAADAI